MNKKLLVFAVILNIMLGSCVTTNSNSMLSLDDAIQKSSLEIAGNLKPGTIIAVLTVASESEKITEYIIEELTTYLPKNNNITIVDRENLDLLQQEIDFQLSGEVSDESAQAIGKKLGAQSIVYGTLTKVLGNYRLRMKTINVETAVIESATSYDIGSNDRNITMLKGQEKNDLLESTATRYVAEDGFFTIDKPIDWELIDNPMLKYKMIKAPDEFGATISVIITSEEYAGTLNNYFEASIDVLERLVGGYNFTEPREFVTKNGLKGVKIMGEAYMNDIAVTQFVYMFLGKGNTKVNISCNIAIKDDGGYSYEEMWIFEKMGYFDQIVRSLVLLE
jgi:TolB-like protein